MKRPYVATPVSGVVVRRAELDEVEAVLESVRELAKALPTAAHWSRAGLYPYVATDGVDGALQAKAMFLACVTGATPSTSGAGGESSLSTPVAPIDGIVGFAAFSAILAVGAAEATLENMAVASSWQRQGIGRRLLAAGLLWCRAHGSAAMFLEVRKSNRPAVALYERAGFSVVGNRPGYYRKPAEDGLQMQKRLIL